ncbi:hypothetical protein Sfulv_61270 [Streptomyces fulvorobeus]|uniref:Methyltransferase domain-containing protein n=1 Tax=Streptomyces fulvorobeus TaxID=284028 RepID=A0A7J0CHW0_9ACTN|nr:hypothetical protein Sfulv_61270 [Streptomyces fulvorobeus]
MRCGAGKFAQKLALRGIAVDAVDAERDVIAAAQKQASALNFPGQINFEQADIMHMALSPQTYDYISCLASIQHVPIETVQKLRESLTPNGVLVVLGCYREATLWDHAVSVRAVPLNALWRTVVFFREKPRARSSLQVFRPP